MAKEEHKKQRGIQRGLRTEKNTMKSRENLNWDHFIASAVPTEWPEDEQMRTGLISTY